MAALMQGVQYGLSSQGTFEGNKSLIFVKLTDSAYRAIEDYLKNKNRINATPKIQFLGNEGHLSFPSTNETSHRFTFSLNNNADIEGPQGSFECIQKTGSKNLESLGALQCKMRIQAKDDVYEATRHRMAVAEEAQKKNRTREIKPGGPGIGKKVKLTPGAAPRRSHDPSPTAAPPSSLGVMGADSVSPALRPSYGSSAKTLGALPNGFHHHNGAVNGSAAGRGPIGHRYPGNPEIMKRPIRERLIHMLAVRNYKKPELVDRLHRDGLKDRDRKIMPDVLKQVSMLRDNSYQLLRHLWNDVQENWPFYSEQERQSLKRRRPQNLTPPGGSDGGSSSGSGQSPTSTHPGSPPPPTVKRPGYVDGADGLPTKRPRISHYKRPTPTPPEDSGGDRGGGGGLGGGGLARWAGGGGGGGSYGGGAATVARAQQQQQQQHLPPLPLTRVSSVPPPPPPSYAPPVPAAPPAAPVPRPAPPPAEEERPVRRPPLPAEPAPPAPPVPAREVVRETREFREARDFREFRESREAVREAVRDVGRSAREAARDVTVRGDLRDESSNESLADAAPPQQEYPEYLSSYTTILDSEQRSRYKADFNADYNEYRDLHAAVENVSRHFAELEERLRQEEVNSPGWRSIKQQIMREYQENKRDQQHQEAKRRFQYLHEKLSHIKRLVQEYDSELAGQQY